MTRAYVITGAAQGIGRALTEHLLTHPNTTVTILDRHPSTLTWTHH
ncbi:short-chain dehydrogenase, partial [Marinitenerispora sediminis]